MLGTPTLSIPIRGATSGAPRFYRAEAHEPLRLRSSDWARPATLQRIRAGSRPHRENHRRLAAIVRTRLRVRPLPSTANRVVRTLPIKFLGSSL
jgi:hypothetical protein